jgi:hypothetical protein
MASAMVNEGRISTNILEKGLASNENPGKKMASVFSRENVIVNGSVMLIRSLSGTPVVKAFDLKGRLMPVECRTVGQNMAVDLGKFPPSSYLVVISVNGNSVIRKVMIGR